jgi:hypothetical protein
VYGLQDVRWRTVDVSGARVELLEVGSGQPVHESLAVHALLELQQRGVAPAVAAAILAQAITDPSKPPVEVLGATAPLLTASQPPMGRG